MRARSIQILNMEIRLSHCEKYSYKLKILNSLTEKGT